MRPATGVRGPSLVETAYVVCAERGAGRGDIRGSACVGRPCCSTSTWRRYAVEVRALVQAVRRNAQRFPADFMFRLTREDVGRRAMCHILGTASRRTCSRMAATSAPCRGCSDTQAWPRR